MEIEDGAVAASASQEVVVIPVPIAEQAEEAGNKRARSNEFETSRSRSEKSDTDSVRIPPEVHVEVGSKHRQTSGRGVAPNARAFISASGVSKSRQKSEDGTQEFSASRSMRKDGSDEHSLRRNGSSSNSRRQSKRLKEGSGRLASTNAEDAISVHSGHRSLRSLGSQRSMAVTEATSLGSRLSKSSVFTNYTESEATFRRAYSSKVLGAHPDLSRMSRDMKSERAESIREINALDRVVSVSDTGRFYYIHENAGVLDGRSFQAGPELIFVDDITLGVEMSTKEARKLTLVDYVRVAGVGVIFDDLTRCDEAYGKLHSSWKKRRNAPPLVVGSIGMDVVLLPGEAKFYDRTILDEFGMVVVASWLSEEFSIVQLQDFKYALRRERKKVQKQKKEYIRDMAMGGSGPDGTRSGDTETLHTVISERAQDSGTVGEQDTSGLTSTEPDAGSEFEEAITALEQRLECVRNAIETVKEYERQEAEEQRKLYQPRSVASAMGLVDSSESEEIDDDEQGGFDRYEDYENYELENEDDEDDASDADESKLQEQLKMPFAKFIALQAKMKKSQAKPDPVIRRVPSVKSEKSKKTVSFKGVLPVKKGGEPEPEFYGDPRLLNQTGVDADPSVLRDPARFGPSTSVSNPVTAAYESDSDDEKSRQKESASSGNESQELAAVTSHLAAKRRERDPQSVVSQSQEGGTIRGSVPSVGIGGQDSAAAPSLSPQSAAAEGGVQADAGSAGEETRFMSFAERQRAFEEAQLGGKSEKGPPVNPEKGSGKSVAERQKELEGRHLASLVTDDMKIQTGLNKLNLGSGASAGSSSVSGSIGDMQQKLSAQSGFLRRKEHEDG